MDAKGNLQRKQIVEILDRTRRGHIGSALSVLEIVRVLYDSVLKVDPKNPEWDERDRFILSKGHGCLALYVQLAEKGFFPKKELFKFCAADGILGGHPEKATTPGVEASTGSLGHGLSIATGIALAGQIDKKEFRTFALLGDGECDEGSVWEAALFATKHKLDRLVAVVDRNQMQCYSATRDVLDLEPFAEKWKTFGFEVRECDGHDPAELSRIFSEIPFRAGKPSCLICRTVKGKGIPFLENNPEWHHKARISDEEMQALRSAVEAR